MARYSNDPYWLTTKRAGYCANCAAAIRPGERVFYYPKGKRIFSGECAKRAAADFNCAAADESFYGAA